MNRSAKIFRVISSICILLNLAAFFLTVTMRTQENYATLKWSQFDYIKGIFDRGHIGAPIPNIEFAQILWILIFMAAPFILTIVHGIYEIVKNSRQLVSCIIIFTIFAMYLIMVISIQAIWPEASGGQFYERGIACTWHLLCSGCAAVCAAIALIKAPRTRKPVPNVIPQVREIKQQQVEAKYNIITENSKKEQQPAAYVPGAPRGVLVGLKGIYAGAEIPLPPSEFIKLGRSTGNHLVFENQEKVSREHCKIKWDNHRKKYIFCDFSSNGTFVNGSEDCLPQNLEMEMEPGTIVAIGNASNTFRLE